MNTIAFTKGVEKGRNVISLLLGHHPTEVQIPYLCLQRHELAGDQWTLEQFTKLTVDQHKATHGVESTFRVLMLEVTDSERN